MTRRKDDARFWYDIRDVSNSHAEVTVGIAGLALALLLIIPIFGGTELSLIDNPELINAMLFFFFALGFGILASLTYSVLSGDVREESDRLLAFIGPSIAFGIAAPSLFLGFLYVVIAYLPMESALASALQAMRLFSGLALWLSAVLITRTTTEIIAFVQSKDKGQPFLSPWFQKKRVIGLLIVYFIVINLSVIFSEGWHVFAQGTIYYFYYLILLALLSAAYYAISTYQGNINFAVGLLEQQKYRQYVINLANILLWAFTIFVLWTAIAFL